MNLPQKRGGFSLSVSETTCMKLKDKIKAKHKKGIRLRLVSDGCAAYAYDMDLGTKRAGDEIQFKTGGIIFFVEKRAPASQAALE